MLTKEASYHEGLCQNYYPSGPDVIKSCAALRMTYPNGSKRRPSRHP